MPLLFLTLLLTFTTVLASFNHLLTTLTTDMTGWKDMNNNNILTSNCAGDVITGGYNV